MSKVKIHEFDPVIYPFKLWIMVTNNVNDVNNNFTDRKGNLIDKEYFDRQAAITQFVIKKDTEQYGVLISFNNKKCLDINTIAHESYHFADYFADEMGMDCERRQ